MVIIKRIQLSFFFGKTKPGYGSTKRDSYNVEEKEKTYKEIRDNAPLTIKKSEIGKIIVSPHIDGTKHCNLEDFGFLVTIYYLEEKDLKAIKKQLKDFNFNKLLSEII